MKIGFDAKRAFLNASGLGNYSRNTLNALRKYFPENNYTLFTPEIKKELFSNYKQFDIISPDSSLSKLFKSLWRSFAVSRQLKKYNLDIFHGLSNELPDGIHKSGVPAVVTIHDLIFMRFPQFYKSIDRRIYYQKVKYACNSAKKIIAISQQTKDDIIEYFKIDPEKIEVIYQSVSPRFYERQECEHLVSKYNLPNNFILSVGTIEQRKNQLSILKAIYSEQIKNTVIYVGKPTLYSAELLKFITENKMELQVKFLNGISEKDLAGLYQLASLSVYISVFEGFGLPVIESLASGCPVITSNVSCLPETAGGAAILCDPENIMEIGEKIKLLLEDDSFRNEMIQKGTERAKLFHPEKYSQNLISLYSDIL
ncbi:MAG: glycosyltransferase family 4 protein [Draconibacterium sp.]|nr:glycosyltransferase family 4 protein [Draconibacterium sp.]